MSNYTYPTLAGLEFGVTRVPMFNTSVKRSVSGNEARGAFMAYPLWTFTLSYEFLRHNAVMNELRQLCGFFLARRGKYDSFLFTDPDDYSVTDQNIGTGDGAATTFQLQRTFGYGTGSTFTEPVHNKNVITNVKVAGVAATYTVSATGLITITSGTPTVGQAVTWTGTFYQRCRFEQDEAEFSKFMQDLWELKSLQFIGSPMNKV